jgi:hypothetical protein
MKVFKFFSFAVVLCFSQYLYAQDSFQIEEDHVSYSNFKSFQWNSDSGICLPIIYQNRSFNALSNTKTSMQRITFLSDDHNNSCHLQLLANITGSILVFTGVAAIIVSPFVFTIFNNDIRNISFNNPYVTKAACLWGGGFALLITGGFIKGKFSIK